jgi:alpha-L-rhamnosidase
MDAPAGSYRGSTNPELIQAAYYVYDISLVIKAYEELGLDATEYKERYAKAKERFNSDFTEYKTQTECVLALHFDLAYDKAALAKQLAEMVHSNGDKLTTGFVGTPYLLHALSNNGYTDLAYTLLLQEGYPSWLFSVNMGATTMWEHWDGVNDKGDVWSRDMNSFNHYAYGAVADWVYEFAAGIKPEKAGFEKIRIEPNPDERLGFLDVSIDTRKGKVSSKWIFKNGKVQYEITTPSEADIVIDGKTYSVKPGTYMF